MKILFVVWSLTQQKGGRERAGATLANAMHERGHDVVVLTDDHRKRPSLYPLNDGVKLTYMDLFDNSYSRHKLRKQLVAEDPDVVMTMCSSREIIDWPVLLKGTGIPLIISERVDPTVTERDCWESKEERLAVLSSADAVHIQMEGYKGYYPDFIKQRLKVIPNPVKAATSLADASGTNQETKIIINVARISEKQKRQRLLTRSFAKIANDFPDWQLHFWGGGARISGDDLQKEIDEAGLTGRALVCWMTDNIEEKLINAQVFAFPSEMEGCPNALLEAQAHGLPAIGYKNCGGTNEIIIDGENGFLFEKLEVDDIASSLKLLLEDADLRKRFGDAAFQNSKRFSPDFVFSQYEAMFEEVAGRKGSTRIDSAPQKEELDYRGYMEDLISREFVHKLKRVEKKPFLLAMVENTRKQISRSYIRPLRDFIRTLRGKRVKK